MTDTRVYPSAGRWGTRWRRVRQQVIDEETLCVRCGQPVDKTLPGTVSRGPSADHYPIPREQLIAAGGDPNDRDTLRLAHLGCNSGHTNRAPVPVRVAGSRMF